MRPNATISSIVMQTQEATAREVDFYESDIKYRTVNRAVAQAKATKKEDERVRKV